MSRARFAFAAHPDAIHDLHDLPDDVRGIALLQLQDLVLGHPGAKPLEGRLEGFHKIYIDPAPDQRRWRMVVQFRDAPPSSAHRREIYLVAAGARRDYAVYRTAQSRTHRTDTGSLKAADPVIEARVRAAQARSPHAGHRLPAGVAAVIPPSGSARPRSPRPTH